MTARKKKTSEVQEAYERAAEAFDAADESGDEDALEAASALVRRAREAASALVRARPGDDDALELAWEAWQLVLDALAALPRAFRGEDLTAQARADLGDEPLAELVAGLHAFYGARFDAAVERLGRYAALEPEDALGAHYHGCALERVGRLADADRELRRASSLDPEGYVVPFRTTETDARACLEAAVDELPEAIREAVARDFSFVIEDSPSPAAVREGTDPLILGEFRGSSLLERDGAAPPGPGEVVVFRRNLEKVCRDRDELTEELRVTIFHEIGHALGFDEEGVDELGLG